MVQRGETPPNIRKDIGECSCRHARRAMWGAVRGLIESSREIGMRSNSAAASWRLDYTFLVVSLYPSGVLQPQTLVARSGLPAGPLSAPPAPFNGAAAQAVAGQQRGRPRRHHTAHATPARPGPRGPALGVSPGGPGARPRARVPQRQSGGGSQALAGHASRHGRAAATPHPEVSRVASGIRTRTSFTSPVLSRFHHHLCIAAPPWRRAAHRDSLPFAVRTRTSPTPPWLPTTAATTDTRPTRAPTARLPRRGPQSATCHRKPPRPCQGCRLVPPHRPPGLPLAPRRARRARAPPRSRRWPPRPPRPRRLQGRSRPSRLTTTCTTAGGARRAAQPRRTRPRAAEGPGAGATPLWGTHAAMRVG